jgi:hypothetical protein
MANKNWQKAQRAASSPEARAKAVATRKRRQDEALLKHAKMVTDGPDGEPQSVSIPLDMIPDTPPRKKQAKKVQAKPDRSAREAVVLALLRYLNGE